MKRYLSISNSSIRTFVVTVGALLISSASSSFAETKPSVFFKSPPNNATVSSPVKVEMGISGYTVAPAGNVKEGTGHHHIIVDGGPLKKGEVVIADATHIHFGKGQTETELTLTPGDHTLTLQLADGAHRSYGPELASTIKVHVK